VPETQGEKDPAAAQSGTEPRARPLSPPRANAPTSTAQPAPALLPAPSPRPTEEDVEHPHRGEEQAQLHEDPAHLPAAAAGASAESLEGMSAPSCSAGAPWKPTLTLCVLPQRPTADTDQTPAQRRTPQQPSPGRTAQMREDRLCQARGDTGIPDRHPQALSALLTTITSTSSALKHPLLPAHSSAPVCSCHPSRPARAVPPSPRATSSPSCWPCWGKKSLKRKAELTQGAEHPGLALLPGPAGRWSRRLPPLPLQSWAGREGQEQQSCQPRSAPLESVRSLLPPAFPLRRPQHPLRLRSLQRQRAETSAPGKGNAGPGCSAAPTQPWKQSAWWGAAATTQARDSGCSQPAAKAATPSPSSQIPLGTAACVLRQKQRVLCTCTQYLFSLLQTCCMPDGNSGNEQELRNPGHSALSLGRAKLRLSTSAALVRAKHCWNPLNFWKREGEKTEQRKITKKTDEEENADQKNEREFV